MDGSAASELDELAHEVGVFDLEPYAHSLVLAELVASGTDHEVDGVRHIPPRLANKLNCSHLGILSLATDFRSGRSITYNVLIVNSIYTTNAPKRGAGRGTA